MSDSLKIYAQNKLQLAYKEELLFLACLHSVWSKKIKVTRTTIFCFYVIIEATIKAENALASKMFIC